MKKVCAFLLALMLLCSSALAEETVKRGKSLGISKDEWVARYNAVPEIIAQFSTPVYFIDIGVTDYRQIYYATPIDGIQFSISCEDTTDQVFATLVQTDLTAQEDDYNTGERIGEFLVESFVRMIYATTPNIDIASLDEVLKLIDGNALTEGLEFDHSFEIDTVRYVCNFQDGILSVGVRSTDVFDSEEDFQAYRNATK